MGQNSPEAFVYNGAKSCTTGEFIVTVVCFYLGLKKYCKKKKKKKKVDHVYETCFMFI